MKLVLGREWDGDPNTPGGPLDWAPLLYACHSCFADDCARQETARTRCRPKRLLRQRVREHVRALWCRGHQARSGADAGAAGGRREPERRRVRLPLDRGGEPGLLRILLEHGAETADTNAIAHALDDERLEHVRLLLEHGADPNEGFSVAHAVRRGRGPEVIELLVSHGADVDRPGGETWRGDVPLRTPYQHAVLRGKDDLAQLLARLGASTDVDPADAAVALDRARRAADDAAPGDTGSRRAGGDRPLGAERERSTSCSTWSGPTSGVSSSAHPPGRCSTTPPGSALSEHASGCSSVAPTPWRVPTSTRRSPGRRTARRTTGPDGDHVGVAERLVAAGAEIEPRFLELADGPLAEWLQSKSIASPNE